MSEETQAYQEVNETGYRALFINSERPPDKIEPLNHFSYIRTDDGVQFSRLCRLTYMRDVGDGYEVADRLLSWEHFEVKRWCEQALINMIDGMKAAVEFEKE